MRFKLAAVAATATVIVGSASAAQLAWRVVASKSVSGEFAVTAVSATIKHPRGMAVRFRGNVEGGDAVVACSRGFSVASYSRSFHRAGLYRLKINPRHADSCEVTASISGSGRIRVQILKAR